MSLDAQILTALRSTPNGAVSGAELSQKLGVSRAAIWARIEDLRALGYEIEATPHLGYRLISSPDVLHGDDLFSRLGKVRVIGRDIRVFQQTTSTNDVMEKLARDGVKEGVVAFAESQSKGRGRLGRKWMSPAGKGLWFSFLLRPDLNPQQTTRLTVTTATALRRAIHLHTGTAPSIKWPNDILVNGHKVAGILTELNAELDHIKYVIVGVGIDVNQSAADFPPELRGIASSLRLECGRSFSRAELAVEVLRQLDHDYARLIDGHFEEISEEWGDHCVTLGQTVVIRIGERRVRGRAESLSEDGALLLRGEHGHLESIIGGDVGVEKS
jgi:BirA family biotin operon repressor/biotin-[acetyl-CoA-carboxylase] ligase